MLCHKPNIWPRLKPKLWDDEENEILESDDIGPQLSAALLSMVGYSSRSLEQRSKEA